MSEDIVNNKLKRVKSPPHSLDQQYLKNITALNDTVISEAVRQRDNNSAGSLLTQLEHSIKNGNYGTYSSSKKQFYYHLYVCYYNKALVYQDNGDNNKAKEYLQKAIQSYEKIQGFITNREENLVFIGDLARTQLQYCGLLSHCNMHSEATVLAEKSLDRVIQSARILQAVCYEQALFNAQRETTCSSRQKGTRSQYVDFKSVVIEQAENILHQLAHLSPVHKLVTEDRAHYEAVIARIFAWKENEANNEAAIRKELKVKPEKSARSILGLQKQMVQNQYEIGTFMTLTFKNIGYTPHPDPLRLLSTHYLKQLAFYSAIGYFTMATQMRFSQPDLSQIRGSMKIDQKYKKLNHDERIIKCKIMHLKALEVAGRLLPSGNALFGHLAQSFCRNYKFVMDEIGQVSQMNSTHMVEKGNLYQYKEEVNTESQYGIKGVTPSRRAPRESSKMDRSKSKKKQQKKGRSKSQSKLRSLSGRKKSLI